MNSDLNCVNPFAWSAVIPSAQKFSTKGHQLINFHPSTLENNVLKEFHREEHFFKFARYVVALFIGYM